MSNKETYINRFFLFFILLTLCGCSESLVQNPLPFMGGDSTGTKSTNLSSIYYYWYKGEKIPLTINLTNVNLILKDSSSIEQIVSQLCRDYQLTYNEDGTCGKLVKVKFSASFTDIGDYDYLVDKLCTDDRVSAVCPFFERGHGASPIGTSNIFYLRLKGDEQYDLPVESRQYDIEPLVNNSQKFGTRIIGAVPYMPDWYILSIEGSQFKNSIEAVNAFYESGFFEDVDPAFMFNFMPDSPNDPLYNSQWALKNNTNSGYDINVEGAWEITRGNGARIAIVDQGVDTSHNDLSTNHSFPSYDAQLQVCPSVFRPGKNHGTHVAGIMTARANNNLQIAGVANQSQLIIVSHDLAINQTIGAELASGISWINAHGAEVINCSWGDQGGAYYNNMYSSVLDNAISNALSFTRQRKGTVVVFAAGNYGNNGAIMDYPANSDDRILTVGSITSNGFRSYFSGYGNKLDVVAPGEGIISTLPGNTTGAMTGTSMAAPHVSGIAALMLAENPELTRETVVRYIEMTAKKINPIGSYTYSLTSSRRNGTWNNQMGYGLVDATAAVSVARDSHIEPPYGSPGLNYFALSGVAAQYDDWIVMGASSNAMLQFSLKPEQINTSYHYFWHFATSGAVDWAPTFDYVADDYGARLNIPRPNTDSVITMSCEIYNGSTHICTANFELAVRLNFP